MNLIYFRFLFLVFSISFLLTQRVNASPKAKPILASRENPSKKEFLSVIQSDVPAFSTMFIDRKVDPCTDFYAYACGEWKKAYPLGTSSVINPLSQMTQRNSEFLIHLLEKLSSKQESALLPSEQKVGDYYASCMDEASIDKVGIGPLHSELELINQINSLEDLALVLGHLNITMAETPIFQFGGAPDFDQPLMQIAVLLPGSQGLPRSNYYASDQPQMQETRTAYRRYMKQLLTMSGIPAQEASKQVESIIKMETVLAKAAVFSIQDDPKNLNHKMSFEKLQTLVPSFSWKLYISALEITEPPVVNVINASFFSVLEKQLKENSLDDWKAYLRFHLLSQWAPYLSSSHSSFFQTYFTFYENHLKGEKKLISRDKFCIEKISGQIPDELGQIFVRNAFSIGLKNQVKEMVITLQKEVKKRLEQLPWIQEKTRQEALIKLSAIQESIGSPEYIQEDETILIRKGDFLGNAMRAIAFRSRHFLSSIGKPVNTNEWMITGPYTINGFFDPQKNKVILTAGILQPPVFDGSAPDTFNYARLGYTVGHEFIHAFDSMGRRFDAHGNIRDWWLPKDAEAFESRAQCLVKQYSQYQTVDNLAVDGNLTLRENIADLGGLTLAYYAFQQASFHLPPSAQMQQQRISSPAFPHSNISQDISGNSAFSKDQIFFISYAQQYCENASDEYQRYRVKIDPHAPPKDRVNGVLSNMPEFQKAFSCSTEKPMVRQNRCQIW